MEPGEMHARAQSVFESVLLQVTDDDLDRATPCAGWSVDDLLTHVLEGNRLAADRVGGGAPRLPDGDRLTVHQAAAEQAGTAFTQPGWQDRTVELLEPDGVLAHLGGGRKEPDGCEPRCRRSVGLELAGTRINAGIGGTVHGTRRKMS